MNVSRNVVVVLRLVLAIITLQSMGIADETPLWKAGVAKSVITPPEPMWMSGYASRDKPANGTIHDLWAKAIVLEDAVGHRVVLVTLDLVGIDRATSLSICGALQDRYQLTRHQVALSTSHTHSGPVVGQNLITMYGFDEANHELVKKYTVFLEATLVDLVGKAIESLSN